MQIHFLHCFLKFETFFYKGLNEIWEKLMHFLTCFQQDRNIIDLMPREYDTYNPSTLMPGGRETDSQVQTGSKNDTLFQRVKEKKIMLHFDLHIHLHGEYPE